VEKIVTTEFCKKYISLFFDFEKGFLPVEFQFDIDEYKHWFESEYFFCHGIIDFNSNGNWSIKGVISFFITNKSCYDRLIRGEIEEYELLPYDLRSVPVLYYSSAINIGKISTRNLMTGILKEVSASEILSKIAFCIVTSENGERHVRRNGFIPNNSNYKGRFGVFFLKKESVATYLDWLGVLSHKG